MPPIRIKKFSNEIINDITRGNNVHMLYHIHRRQEDFTNDHKVNPTPVSSIPTIALPHGPVSLTLVTTSTILDSGSIPTPTDIDATDIDTATPIATDISATDTNIGTATPIATDISATATVTAIPTDTSIPKIPKIPFPSIPPSITTPVNTVTPIQTQNPITSPFSIFPSTTTTTTSSSSSSSPPPSLPSLPSSGPSNDTKSNNLHVWMFSILAILILIMILAVLALIYRKRKRKENTLHNTNAGDITDKDKENSSKSNSLTSSINSISSSLKMKKGKIVPADINVGSPPVQSIVNNKDDEEKPHMPTLKRTPTTVSAFQELVDLTDDEHFNLRQSTSSGIYTIASRLSSTPTYVNYDAEEGSSSNVNNVIPLHQERIDIMIPRSSTDGSGGFLTRTFTSTNPFNTSNNNHQ